MPLQNTDISKRLLAAFNDSNSSLITECSKISKEIEDGHLKLYQFVEDIGFLVTSEDVSLREKGITTLSNVLLNLPRDFLQENELHFITMFYCDRLKDHHSIIPAVLRGILTIVQMKWLPEESPVLFFRNMFQHIQCQSQSQAERRNIYLIFETILNRKPDTLKSMGGEFIFGVINAIDGERDPRNLLLLFNILPQFIREFQLGELKEEIFEIISSYFPIDFRGSSSNGATVTKEMLTEALAPCLCAIPEFAEFCVPLIIEKLSSDLKVAKLDSLHLLCKGTPVFGVNGIQKYIDELWPMLRSEVLPGSDTDVKTIGLQALTVITETLSKDDTVFDNFIQKVITDTKSSLCDVELSLYTHAEKLLESVAKANSKSCTRILRVIVPLCLAQYSTKTTLRDKVILMETLNRFMKICSDQGFAVKDVSDLAWTDIPSLYLQELFSMDHEMKIKAYTGLILQNSSLTETNRCSLYEKLVEDIDNGDNELKNICHACLFKFGNTHQSEISNIIENRLRLNHENTEVPILARRLEALTSIAKIKELGERVIPSIVSVATSNNTTIGLTGLNCLYTLVVTKNDDFNINNFLYKKCDIIGKLVESKVNYDNQRIFLISSICHVIIRRLSIQEQQSIIKKYTSDFKIDDIHEENVIILYSLLTPLRPNVYIDQLHSLLEHLPVFAVKSSDFNVRLASCKLTALLLNKMSEADECCERILSTFKETIRQNLEIKGTLIDEKKATVILTLWITKALIIKGDSHSQDFLDYAINILKSDDIGETAAMEFKMLVDKLEDTITEQNFCTVRIFYKQRIFQSLMAQNKNFEHDRISRQNYLVALTHLLEEIPMELLFMHLSQVVPLLIESLSMDEPLLILSTLSILKVLLKTKNEIFVEKAQCFIPKFLHFTNFNKMRVRILALECLVNYSNFPTISIQPYKENVIEKLSDALDDRKRLVRKVAVVARTRWCLVGSPAVNK